MHTQSHQQAGGGMPDLTYIPGERLRVSKPVDTLSYLENVAKGRRVLDIGCLDETALDKINTPDWVHGRLAKTAQKIVGVDKSELIPEGGLETPAGMVLYGDINRLANPVMPDAEVLFVCNLIEHLEDPIAALKNLRREFGSAELVVLTPNATSLTNVGLAALRRESMHPDHVAIFSFKTLNTVMLRSGYTNFRIIPSHTHYPEAIRRMQGWRRGAVKALESTVRVTEAILPMYSAGFIVHAGPQNPTPAA